VANEPWVTLIMIAITSVLMVSRLPTPSIKYMKLQRQHRVAAVVSLNSGNENEPPVLIHQVP